MDKPRNLVSLFLMFMLLTFSLQLSAVEEVRIIKASPELIANGSNEYIMIFKNFKTNQKFTISYARVIQKDPGNYKPLDTLRIDEKNIIHVNGMHQTKFYSTQYPGFAPGEAIKYKISRPDGKVLAEASFIPNPIRKKSDKGTFYIQAELRAIYPTMYEITYDGIEKNEKLHCTSTSASEHLESDDVYDPANKYLHLPGVNGLSGGSSQMEVVRSTGDKVILDLKWDDAIIKELQKNLKSKF
jgi:hypothetical protein